jgi:hypothetical protein
MYRGQGLFPRAPIIDPITAASKINTQRWSAFLTDIKGESVRFREVLVRASADHKSVDARFRKCAQLSFNAIHNVKRVKPSEDNGVFRLTRLPGKTPEETQPDPMDYIGTGGVVFCPPSYRPRRAASAAHALAPAKLDEVYAVEPKVRDIPVVCGAPAQGEDVL